MKEVVERVGTAMWHLHSYDTVSSTNDLARDLTAWNAVTARTQTAGRGRFGRSFVSDEGGLWVSAVLPAEGGPARWNGFSLMVGNHLRLWLHRLGLPSARLRWPNDLMVGKKKLAGLLIEQGRHETLIVGLGLNVTNAPWEGNPELADQTGRLVDDLANDVRAQDLVTPVLDALADAHEAMLAGGLERAIADFNHHHQPQPVEILRPDRTSCRGHFTGLDPRGHLLIRQGEATPLTIPHVEVERLLEIADDGNG